MRFRKGEKVALLGGGNAGNTFHVVRFKGFKNGDKIQPILETGDNLPNPFEPHVTEKVEPLPLMGSTWSLGKLPEEVADLPLGHYAVCGNEIRDISHMGLFGSILNAKVVKVLKN